MLEIAQGLMQVQDQSMMDDSHGVTVAEKDNKTSGPRLITPRAEIFPCE
jgi:hypothetical protein